VAFLAIGAFACREVQEAKAPSALPYCRYSQSGPLCDTFDPSTISYAAPLTLRSLDVLEPHDRQLIERQAASMSPRPASLRVLAPTGPAPAGRAPLPDHMPQAEPAFGNPRLAIMAFGAASGRVDIHAVTLFEDRVVATQLLAQGLRAETLRGAAHNGSFRMGFSLSDRPGSVGDLFRLRASQSASPGSSVLEGLVTRRWQRIAADAPERKTQFFESIVNDGSCADAGPGIPLLLAPAPQAWLDEYSANGPLHPDMEELRRRANPMG
jgi:hypothetical protein